MTMSRTNMILLVLAVIVLAAAGFLLLRSPEAESGVSSQTRSASQAELVFLNLTAQIEPVAFNTGILSDERFMSLVDIRTAILPEPAGRLDPFGPLGAQ